MEKVMSHALPSTVSELERFIDERLQHALQDNQPNPNHRLVPQPEVLHVLGVSGNTLHRRIEGGLVPKPRKIRGRNFWWLDELLVHVEKNLAPDELPAAVRTELDRGRRLRHV